MPIPSVKRSFSATQIVAKLAQLDGWTLSGESATLAITKTYGFPDFAAAMAFANAVAFVAGRMNHHPELLLASDRCTVRWRTHDADGITAADFDAAGRTDALLS
jgi:4a-hydroxytetrahydrobiopterin dehydratase